MAFWQMVVIEPARQILALVGQFLIKLVGALALLALGWLISLGVKAIVTKVLRPLDKYADKAGVTEKFEKSGIGYSVSELLGVSCYWIGILVSIMVVVDALGLAAATVLLERVIGYIPNVVSAIFIILVGIFVANLLKTIVLGTANNAGIVQSKLLAKVVEAAIVLFSIFIALEQLNLGIRITQLTLGITLGAIGLGLALAFGLGCRDLAEKYANELIDKIKSKK